MSIKSALIKTGSGISRLIKTSSRYTITTTGPEGTDSESYEKVTDGVVKTMEGITDLVDGWLTTMPECGLEITVTLKGQEDSTVKVAFPAPQKWLILEKTAIAA